VFDFDIFNICSAHNGKSKNLSEWQAYGMADNWGTFSLNFLIKNLAFSAAFCLTQFQEWVIKWNPNIFKLTVFI
jgi:hypothetical protein